MKKIKFNLIDVLVVCMVIFMIFAIRQRFKNYHRVDDDTATQNQMTYEMRFSSVRNFTLDAFEVGDSVYDSLTGVEIGKIIDKKVENATTHVNLNDGSVVKTDLEGRYDLILQLETSGIINDSGYYASNTVELKVGSEKKVETFYAKSTGRIVSIAEKSVQ